MSKDFCKNELITILEIIESARICGTEACLQQLIIQAKELLNADYCICGLGKTGANGLSEVLMIANGDYPAEWLNLYKTEELHKVDPIVKHHCQFSSMTQFWSDSFRSYADEISKKFLNDASDFGLRYGITGGVYVPETKNISLFSFASNHNRFSVHHKKIADILTLHFHKTLVQIYESKNMTELSPQYL